QTTNFMCFDALKSGAFSKRLLNETTWNKQRRRKRTDNTRENVISASKSAFVPTSSPSGVATKNRLSIVLLCQDQRTKQPLGHFQNLGLKIAKTGFW
ncbi:hypothetical protein, partial [Vibrio parahaemolyticus]|uniref:hypothetical protein n=1 Tax=Vibrio parahaemolyticus TaxID=670 RepID=UPI00215249D1